MIAVFSNEGLFVTAFGEIDLQNRTMNGKPIPADVIARGYRLVKHGLYASAWDYVGEWMWKKGDAI